MTGQDKMYVKFIILSIYILSSVEILQYYMFFENIFGSLHIRPVAHVSQFENSSFHC